MSTESNSINVDNLDSKVLTFLSVELALIGGKYYTPPFRVPNDKFDVHTNFVGSYKVLRCVQPKGVFTYVTVSGTPVQITTYGDNEQPFYDVKDGVYMQLELTAPSDIQILL